MTHLCISIRWLDDRYHGLLSRDGPPEWPPSPFRLFQSLVAGAARYGLLESDVAESLGWLESLGAPMVLAPSSFPGQEVTRFVPNNDGDKVRDRQGRLTGKTSRPTIFGDAPVIHYVWPIPGDPGPAAGAIQAARCVSCFGLGIDMAFGSGQLMSEDQIGTLEGIRWFPQPGAFRSDGLLRVPRGGSLKELIRAHESALGRIEEGKPVKAVHKPRVFGHVFYASVDKPAGRPYAVFALRTATDDTYRYPHAKTIHVAGMARSASIEAMKGYPPPGVENAAKWIESFVAGHRVEGEGEHRQFSYIPLPTIGHQHADAMIRRLMISAPFGHDAELRHLAEQLDGVQLQPEDSRDGPILDRLQKDSVTRLYVATGRKWASVTPVILPGHDDHKEAKTAKLIEKALSQSGIEQCCEFTWSAMPNFNSCLTSHKPTENRPGYYRPGHLKELTAVHVRLTFKDPIAGPLTIGAGRHCGLGVFASIEE